MVGMDIVVDVIPDRQNFVHIGHLFGEAAREEVCNLLITRFLQGILLGDFTDDMMRFIHRVKRDGLIITREDVLIRRMFWQIDEGHYGGFHPFVGALGFRVGKFPVQHKFRGLVLRCGDADHILFHRHLLLQINLFQQLLEEEVLGADGVVKDNDGVVLQCRVRYHHGADAVESLAVRAALRQHRVEGVGRGLHLAAVLADGVGLVDDELLKIRIVCNKRLSEIVERHPREDLQLRTLPELGGTVRVQRVALGDELIDGVLFGGLGENWRYSANR